jgi:Ni/Co efflux regulator RcnB
MADTGAQNTSGGGQPSASGYGAIFQALGNAIGGVVGFVVTQAGAEKQKEWLKKAMDEYGNVDLPALQALVAQEVPPTELAKIQLDPQYKASQMAADDSMRQLSEEGGLTLGDKAALTAVRNKVSQSQNAGQARVAQDMSARGQLGSGAQLAMNLSAQQQAADSASEAGQQTAGAAQARAYQAIKDRASMAHANAQQDYQMKSSAAQAQDTINKYNAGERVNASLRGNQVATQNYQNQMGRANLKSNYDTMQGNAAAMSAGAQGQMLNSVFSGAGSAGAGAYQVYDANNKTQASQSSNAPQEGDVRGTKVFRNGEWQES